MAASGGPQNPVLTSAHSSAPMQTLPQRPSALGWHGYTKQKILPSYALPPPALPTKRAREQWAKTCPLNDDSLSIISGSRPRNCSISTIIT